MSDRINMTIPIVERQDMIEKMPGHLQAIGVRVYRMNGCGIIVTCDPPDNLWHISISRGDRDPSWAEIATARYRLLGHVPEMAMYLPPLDEYVNFHPFTFHLYEVKQ
jgi:hypothetical protein